MKRTRAQLFAAVTGSAVVITLIALVAASRRPHTARLEDYVALAEAVQKAVQNADEATMRALTSPTVRNNYRWVREWPQSGLAYGTWRASVVRWRPSESDEDIVLIQVSRPQVTQSTSDHIYETTAEARLGREIPEADLVGARVTHHNLDVTFDIERRTVQIQDEATVRRQTSSYPFALFRLNSYYRIRNLLRDGMPIKFQQVGGFVITEPLPNEQCVMTAEYEAELRNSGETFITEREAAITAYWYLLTARMPVTSTITITAPAGWRSIAPGRLVREERNPATWKSVWSNELPICFLMAVAGQYTVTNGPSGSPSLSCWLLRRSEQRAASALRTTSEAVTWFSQTFGTFPYPHYTVVESRVFPYGLEGYSFTLVGTDMIPGVIPHEVSHTWWGGVVPCRYLKSMWNEAFATYSEELLERARAGWSKEPGEGAFSAGSTLPERPTLLEAVDAMHPDHSAVGYQKGALVLAQVERIVGTETMLRSFRTFISRHTKGEPAEWSDYLNALEGAGAPSAEGLLKPWLEQPGLPTYSLQDFTLQRAERMYRIRGSVTTGEPVRPCRTTIRFLQDGQRKDISLIIRSPRTPVSVELPFRPSTITLDPEGAVLRRPSAPVKP